MGLRNQNYKQLKIVNYKSEDGSEEALLRFHNNTRGALLIRKDDSLPNGFEVYEGDIVSTTDGVKRFDSTEKLTASKVVEKFEGVNPSGLGPFSFGSLRSDTEGKRTQLTNAQNMIREVVSLAKKVVEKECPVEEQKKPAQEKIVRDGSVKHVSVLHAVVNDKETRIIGFSDKSIDINPVTKKPTKPTKKDFVNFSITIADGEEPKISLGDIKIEKGTGRFESFENGKEAGELHAKRQIGVDIDIVADENYTGTECVDDAVALTTDAFNRLRFKVR